MRRAFVFPVVAPGPGSVVHLSIHANLRAELPTYAASKMVSGQLVLNGEAVLLDVTIADSGSITRREAGDVNSAVTPGSNIEMGRSLRLGNLLPRDSSS